MKTFKKKADIIIAALIYYLLSVIVIGSLFSYSNISALIPKKFETPLYHAESISSDGNSLIFVNIHYFRRIQVYNTAGVFLGGWYTDQSRSGSSYLLFRTPDKIELATSSRGETIVYDFTGRITDRKSNDRYYDLTDAGIDQSQTSIGGSVYKIQNRNLFPTVVKKNEDGTVDYLVEGTWWQYLFPSFLVSWLLILALIIISKSIQWAENNKV